MNGLNEYIEHMVRPTKVCIIEEEADVVEQIRKALNVYKCDVEVVTGPCCLQKTHHCDLAFICADMETGHQALESIEASAPNASIVLLTRKPGSAKIADAMKRGAYTFLVKNGSFTQEHIQKITRHLNMKLRARQSG